MVKILENPMKMDDLEVPLFLETLKSLVFYYFLYFSVRRNAEDKRDLAKVSCSSWMIFFLFFAKMGQNYRGSCFKCM